MFAFFGKFGMLSFFETPVLRFSLLPYYRPLMVRKMGRGRPRMSYSGVIVELLSLYNTF